MCVLTARDGWFGTDGYNYFADRGGLPGDHTSIWAPYGGHWEPVIIAVYLLNWHIFGFSTYLPYVLPAILVHLLISWMLFAIMRRLGFGPWVAVSSVWLLLFYGAAAEAYASDAPVALTSALALGLVAVLVVLGGSSLRRQLVATAALLVALGCSVTSVVSIALVAVFLIGMHRLKEAALVAGVPALAFVAWFAVSGRHGGRASFDVELLLDIPAAVWKTLAIPLADVSGVSGAGVLLTAVVILATFLSPAASSAQRSLAWAGLSAGVVQLTLSAVANAGATGTMHGLDSVLSVGRYRYVVLVCLLPAVALTIQWAVSRFERATDGHPRFVPAVLVTVVLTASTLHGIADLRGVKKFNVAVGDSYRDLLYGSVAAISLGERMLFFQGPVFMDGHDLEKLAAPEAREFYPADFKPTDAQRFRAESELFVGVQATTMSLPAPDGLSSDSFDRPLSNKTGCRDYQATTFAPMITMTSFEGAQIAVTSQASTIRTRLRRGDFSSEPKAWSVWPGQTIFIATSAELAQLDIAFDAGGVFTICRA